MVLKSFILRSLSYVRHMWGRIVAAQLLMIIGSVLGLAMPRILGMIFDMSYELKYMVGLLAGVSILAAIVNYFKTILVGLISNDITLELRESIYRKLQNLPQQYFIDQNTGSILSTVTNDVNLFKDALSSGVLYIAEMFLSFIAVVVLMVSIDSTLTVLLFIMFALMMITSHYIGKPAERISASTQTHLAEITDVLNQSVSGMEVIKTYSLENISRSIFRSVSRNWYRSASNLVTVKAKNNLAVGLLRAVQMTLLIGLGFFRVQSGLLTVGELTSFILYSQALSAPINMLTNLYVDVKAAIAAMRRVYHILDLPEEERGGTHSLEKVQGSIAFENVSFAYPKEDGGSHQVLNQVSFSIEAGQSVALVGESGAGKTTLINLLLGFYTPDSGRILIDGIDIQSLDLSVLRSNISVVSQSPYIFDMSIGDNIRCGKPDATEDEVIHAAIHANAHEFIMEMPDGFDTIAGEKGASLSGGQRQRIAIARAFLKNAPILLLDEATSALDNFSEKAVKEAVSRLMKGRTIITIAHRLSTIINSDVIFYLKDGRIHAQGTHKELLKNCPKYASLYRTSSY